MMGVQDEEGSKILFASYVTCVTGPLSLLGACLTLLTIYCKHRKQQRVIRTYHRIMIAIGVCDILFSLGWTLGPLPVPVATGVPGAHGNTASCTLQAFLIQMGLTSFCYNLMLMIYFCLAVRYKVREDALVKGGIEPAMHAVSILYFGSIAVAGVPLAVYNPGPVGRCWIGVWPMDCLDNASVRCERGEHSLFFAFWFVVVPLLIILLLILVCLIIVIVSVWQRYTRSRRRTELSELFGEVSMSFGDVMNQRRQRNQTLPTKACFHQE